MHLPPCMRRAWRRTWSVACRGATARRDAVTYWHRRRRYNGCGSGWKGRQSSLKTAARPRWSCASRTRPPGTRLRSSGPPTKRLHATTSTSPRLPFPSLPDLVCSARQRVAAVSVLAWAAGGVGSAWGGRRGADELPVAWLRAVVVWWRAEPGTSGQRARPGLARVLAVLFLMSVPCIAHGTARRRTYVGRCHWTPSRKCACASVCLPSRIFRVPVVVSLMLHGM